MELVGSSSRLVHPGRNVRAGAASSSSVEKPSALFAFFNNGVFISLDPDTDPSGDGTRAGIVQEIGAPLGQTADARIRMDFWIITGVAGAEQQVVARKEGSRPLELSSQSRDIKRPSDRDVLEAGERSVLDPAGRVAGRLLDVWRIAERAFEEVFALQEIGLCRINQCSVVEDLHNRLSG